MTTHAKAVRIMQAHKIDWSNVEQPMFVKVNKIHGSPSFFEVAGCFPIEAHPEIMLSDILILCGWEIKIERHPDRWSVLFPVSLKQARSDRTAFEEWAR
jgi:hypothetical protein